MKTTAIVCLLITMFHLPVCTQPSPYFEQLTEEDGLANGFVTSIYQDDTGFIWLGTANGLHRYDGYEFKIWLPSDTLSHGLSHPVIWSIGGRKDGTLWIGTARGLNSFDPKAEKFTAYFHDPSNQNSLSDNEVETVFEDHLGALWVGTANGLNLWNAEQATFTRFFNKSETSKQASRGICEDDQGRLWVSSKDTLFQYDRDNNRFLPFPLPKSKSIQLPNRDFVRLLFADSQGNLWLCMETSGLYQFDLKTLHFKAHFEYDLNDPTSISNNRISALMEDGQGNLWVGTSNGGLNFLNISTQQIKRFHPDPFNPAHQHFEVVRSMLSDKAGNLWLGTFYGGVKIVKRKRKPFRNYESIPGNPNSLSGNSLGMAMEREDGKILIPVVGKGIDIFDPRTEHFSHMANAPGGPNSKVRDAVLQLLQDKSGTLWAVTLNKGLWKKEKHTDSWSAFRPSGYQLEDIWLKVVFIDRKENIWIGSQKGLFRYDKSKNTIIQVGLSASKKNTPYGDNAHIMNLHESEDGGLWVSSAGGLNYARSGQQGFTYYPYPHQIMKIHEDKAGDIWLATLGGLARFDQEGQQVVPYKKVPGLNQLIHNILEDDSGTFWMPTHDGIFALNPNEEKLRFYNQKDGLLNKHHFSLNLKTRSGEFYLGGPNGIDRFYPLDIADNNFIPAIRITNFKISNKVVPIQEGNSDKSNPISPLTKNISYTESITLQHWQNDFSFEFSALDFTAPGNNQYRYTLEGYHEQWLETDAENRVAYFTNINPGKYVFKVKGSNNDGLFNQEETRLEIIILGPWWSSWWSYGLYFTAVMLLLFFIRRYELRRKLAQVEAQRLKELNEVKNQLYTNITHEFRTPLTIILGMADELKQQVPPSSKEGLEMITRNGNNLLSLVNQMLDLAKLESGSLKLNWSQGDIILYLEYLTESFSSLANGNNIDLHFSSPIKTLMMDYDPRYLQQVISNLLTNAIKYSSEGGSIYIRVFQQKQLKDSEAVLHIEITDTGVGIPSAEIPHVFDRFYQGSNNNPSTSSSPKSFAYSGGTGIGLALTKELLQMMDGNISVTSFTGKGTTFLITLPIRQQAKFVPHVPKVNKSFPKTFHHLGPVLFKNPFTKNQPTILIIEDNREVMKYLISCLSKDYQLTIAYDGEEGIKKAIKKMPNLIISDVIMPKKDGFEVCRRLKTELLTSHIPIILLTAKVDLDSKIEGLKTGADLYLLKPFHKEELLIQVKNLMGLRLQLQDHLLATAKGMETKSLAQTGIPVASVPENEFLVKINAIMEKRYDDAHFSIEQLSREMGISKTNLYRKLKALTGQSANDLIRSIRIKKAKSLLQEQPELTIAAIAYDCGFSDPDYFTRVFKKEVGMTPSSFRNKKDHPFLFL